jgi:hypothetical protein
MQLLPDNIEITEIQSNSHACFFWKLNAFMNTFSSMASYD